MIAFVGSVFSPYYKFQRRAGSACPENHCALNIALYGRRKRWAMTERGAERLTRDEGMLKIGPSAMHWDGSLLDVEINEWSVPIPGRIRGRIKLALGALGLQQQTFLLTASGDHRWRPIAPSARITVELEAPGLGWVGNAYIDSNWGAAPLEDAFHSWHWSRALLPDGSTTVIYDLKRRDRTELDLALMFRPDGGFEQFQAPQAHRLPATSWGLDQSTRAETEPQVMRKLEDAPFYARSLVKTQILGRPVTAVHESLNLDRFNAPWVQMLLPFRMPRARK